ncbi:MAG: hypothetical protein ACRDU4_08895, partial [Mycobacterium sp.]
MIDDPEPPSSLRRRREPGPPPHLRTGHRVPSIISGSPDTGGSLALLALQAQATFRSMTVVLNGRDDFTLENYRR